MLETAFVVLSGFLYRWGGGGFAFLPAPFNSGWKPARRYILPAIVAFHTGWIIPMVVFSIITHFNIQEIEDRRWDDVATYGFAQAWCFAGAGYASGLIGAWWFAGTWLSNIGCRAPAKWRLRLGDFTGDWRLDWFWVEVIQGCLIGLVSVL